MTADNHNDRQLVEHHTDYFVREITIKKSVSLDWLLDILRTVKTTGNLCVYLSQGGIRRIELHERMAASESESDHIRKILDVGEIG